MIQKPISREGRGQMGDLDGHIDIVGRERGNQGVAGWSWRKPLVSSMVFRERVVVFCRYLVKRATQKSVDVE